MDHGRKTAAAVVPTGFPGRQRWRRRREPRKNQHGWAVRVRRSAERATPSLRCLSAVASHLDAETSCRCCPCPCPTWSSRSDCRREHFGKCELPHRRSGPLVLNRRNEPDATKSIAETVDQRRHRLRVDRHQLHGRTDRVGLSHPGLIRPLLAGEGAEAIDDEYGPDAARFSARRNSLSRPGMTIARPSLGRFRSSGTSGFVHRKIF